MGDPREVLAASRERLESVRGVGPVTARAIVDWPKHFDLRREEDRIASAGLSLVTFLDAEYPKILREIPDPPIALYIRGRLPETKRTVALVGTRRPSPYGAHLAERLARELVSAGVVVVSGLARGIDAAAHRGAISGGGQTVGVIGSGMDTVFPPENAELYRETAAHGAVISEFAFGRPPDKQTFPIRNRVIAGLSHAVVVIESAGTGGAMITANFAGDYGRLLLAIPGRVDQPLAEGPHRLIREGATLCRGIDDILSELAPAQSPPLQHQGELPLASELATCSEAARAILHALQARRALAVDALACAAALGTTDTLTALLELELEGRVRKQLDGRYELID
jgi:DNA processing protein